MSLRDVFDRGGDRHPSLTWDGNAGFAVWVLGALLVLWLIARGFRGFAVSIGD